MVRRFRRAQRRLSGIERLEDRRLLVGEPFAFELDVTQNGASILDANRSFEVEEGEQVNLVVRWDDNRADPQGLASIYSNIVSNSATAFIPAVTESFQVTFSGDFFSLTSGNLVVGAEGTTETRSITLDDFELNTQAAIANAIEGVLGLNPGTVQVEFLSQSNTQFVLGVNYLDKSLALQDIPNITFDTSGLVGATITSDVAETPAYVNNDPSQGVNPAALRTALDFRSPSLNDVEVYDILQFGTYDPVGAILFEDVGGFSSEFVDSISTVAQQLMVPYDGMDFHAFSICLRAVQPQNDVTFTIGFPSNEDVFSYPFGVDPPLEPTDVLIDLDDDPAIPGDDRFALVTGNVTSSTPRPYQNPANRFDVNNDGEDGSASALALLRDIAPIQQELTERNVSDPVTGQLPDIPPVPVTIFFDVNGDGFVTQDDVQALEDEFGAMDDLDFGDAPVSYPTLLPNGARHAESALFLGPTIDLEADGQPSLAANGDGADEDGIELVTNLITSAFGNVTATIRVTASAPGKLDGWIDFNQDGDWADVGEELFPISEDVNAGANLVSFTIPAGSTVGDTYARFRLSSVGGLSPGGSAGDGEVEDYFITLTGGGIGSDLLVDLGFGAAEVRSDAGEVVLHQGGVEVFRAPGAAVSGWSFAGTGGDDMVGIGNLGSAQPSPAPIAFDGGGGTDSLWLIDTGQSLDASSASPNQLSNIETINIVGASPNDLVIDGQGVIDATDAGNTLTVVHDSDDDVQYDGSGWEVEPPIFLDGQQNHVLINDAATLRVINDRPYQNPLVRTDVNFDEETSTLDALNIINFLGQADTLPIQLLPPTNANELPERYYDVNASTTATALDVLNVINELGRLLGQGEQVSVLSGITASVNPAASESMLLETSATSARSPGRLIDASLGDLNANLRRGAQPIDDDVIGGKAAAEPAMVDQALLDLLVTADFPE